MSNGEQLGSAKVGESTGLNFPGHMKEQLARIVVESSLTEAFKKLPQRDKIAVLGSVGLNLTEVVNTNMQNDNFPPMKILTPEEIRATQTYANFQSNVASVGGEDA